MIKDCEYCGVEFIPAWSAGNRQLFCAEPCARAWWKENRDKRKKHRFICKNCGEEYLTQYIDRNQYCSRECAYDDIDSWRVTPNKNKVSSVCDECGEKFHSSELVRFDGQSLCSACQYQLSLFACAHCETEYQATSIRQKYCSLDCQYKANLQMKREQHIPKPYFETQCKECGNKFESNHLGRKYCSEDCVQIVEKKSHADRNARRRARKKGAFVERVVKKEIYERDDWRCQLCGKKVDSNLRYPHLKCATLDHILPLANGGTHERRNVQLAHLICNSTKSNTEPDQLRML